MSEKIIVVPIPLIYEFFLNYRTTKIRLNFKSIWRFAQSQKDFSDYVWRVTLHSTTWKQPQHYNNMYTFSLSLSDSVNKVTAQGCCCCSALLTDSEIVSCHINYISFFVQENRRGDVRLLWHCGKTAQLSTPRRPCLKPRLLHLLLSQPFPPVNTKPGGYRAPEVGDRT